MAVTAAAVTAAGLIAGAASGLLGSIQGDTQAWEDANEKQKELEELYRLNLLHAEEEYKKAQEEANRNARKGELQADLTDKSLDITEQGLANDFNATIDQLYLGQEADAYNWNLSAMQAGSSEGQALANLASSGVRAGGSLSTAVEMESAVNSEQLQFAQDSKRRQDDFSLASVLNSLAGNKFDIMSNRIGADETRSDASYLRNSYLEGGSNWNLYQLQKQEMETTYKYNYEQLQREKDKHTGWNAFFNGLTAMLSLGAKGAQTGYNLYDMSYKAKNYTTTMGGGSNG